MLVGGGSNAAPFFFDNHVLDRLSGGNIVGIRAHASRLNDKGSHMSLQRAMLVATVLAAGCLTAGCASTEWSKKQFPEASTFARYTVTGSRIARTVDPRGQPRTGASVVTISDEQLQQAPGMLLGEKLGNGYPGAARR